MRPHRGWWERRRYVPVYALGDRVPVIDPSAFVHPDAVVIGDAPIDSEATGWPGAVLRGDYGSIFLGARPSVPDAAGIPATREAPTRIGSDCDVGHIARLEGCRIEDHALVGSG